MTSVFFTPSRVSLDQVFRNFFWNIEGPPQFRFPEYSAEYRGSFTSSGVDVVLLPEYSAEYSWCLLAAATLATHNMSSSAADQVRAALREAYKHGDLSQVEYLDELRKLRESTAAAAAPPKEIAHSLDSIACESLVDGSLGMLEENIFSYSREYSKEYRRF